MVDRLIDIEEKDLRIITLHDIGLGKIYDASAVDKQKEFDLLVHSRLFDAGKELGVPGDWVHLILYVLALEEFLHGGRGTEKILSVQRLSTSTAQKTTIDT